MSKSRNSRPRSSSGRSKPSSGAHQQPPRAQTALGFARGTELLRGLQPNGFDVRGYFRKHGSATDISVGVNGRPSSDAALQSYVQDCKMEILQCEIGECGEFLEEEDPVRERCAWRDGVEPGSSELQRLFPVKHKPTPLCWDNLLQERQESIRIPHGVKSKRKVTVIQPSKSAPAVKRPKCENSLIKTLKTSPHMISHDQVCLTDWLSSTQSDTRRPQVSTKRLHLDIHIDTNSTRPRVTPEERRVGSWAAGSRDCHSQLVSELLPALQDCEIGCRSDEGDLLCIWFQTQLTKRLETNARRGMFELSFSYRDSPSGSNTFTCLQLCRVTPAVCVLAVDGVEWRELVGADVSLSCSGTSIFSCPVSVPGSTVPPARFFLKREHLCEQDQDEDLTDMRDLARKFPDLCVLDVDGDGWDQVAEVRGREGEEEGQEGERDVGQPAVFVTIRDRPTVTAKPLYRPPPPPPPSPSTATDHSYTSIVRQHLAQYMH